MPQELKLNESVVELRARGFIDGSTQADIRTGLYYLFNGQEAKLVNPKGEKVTITKTDDKFYLLDFGGK